MRIGLFDSGLGGLTILRAVAKALPQHDFYYYGDTLHLPYGDRSEEEIYVLSQAAVAYLFAQGCMLVVIACNTASAETLRKLQDEYLPHAYPERRILGVIIPTVETLREVGAKEVLLLATKRTVESKKYEREVATREGGMRLHAAATPELVPLIEVGKVDEAVEAAGAVIRIARSEHPSIDTVVLGCTHYTVLAADLRGLFGNEMRFIAQDEVIPAKLAEYICNHPELGGEQGEGKRVIYLTEHRPDYDRIIAQLLGGTFISEERNSS